MGSPMAEQQALPDDISATSGCSTEAAARKPDSSAHTASIFQISGRRAEYTWKQHRDVRRFTTVTLVTKLRSAFLNYEINVI
jgi:hypothetical protein